MGGVLTDLFRSEPVGWTVEIARKVLENSQVGARGRFGVIATREFIERHFSKLGHRDLLVTQTYRHRIPNARPCAREASAVRLSSSGDIGNWAGAVPFRASSFRYRHITSTTDYSADRDGPC